MNGNSIDWTAHSDDDLARFLAELAAEQEHRKAEKRKALKAQIEALLEAHNLSMKEVFQDLSEPNQHGAKRRGRPKGKRHQVGDERAHQSDSEIV
jgi:hypothetical protein